MYCVNVQTRTEHRNCVARHCRSLVARPRALLHSSKFCRGPAAVLTCKTLSVNMSRGCGLDDTELETIEAERPASSGAACASGCASSSRPQDGLPLSWRAAKEGCSSGACKQQCGGGAAAQAAAQQTCVKCREAPPQVCAGTSSTARMRRATRWRAQEETAC